MGKMLVICAAILLALASTTGYLVLTRLIDSGEQEIALGQKQLDRGHHELQEGQTQLSKGKREMGTVKKVNNLPLLGLAIVNLPAAAVAYVEAKQKIAEGDKQIAEGELSVKVGKERLSAGELRLSQGEKELQRAKYLRSACAVAAVLFTLLALGLSFYWHRKKRATKK